ETEGSESQSVLRGGTVPELGHDAEAEGAQFAVVEPLIGAHGIEHQAAGQGGNQQQCPPAGRALHLGGAQGARTGGNEATMVDPPHGLTVGGDHTVDLVCYRRLELPCHHSSSPSMRAMSFDVI